MKNGILLAVVGLVSVGILAFLGCSSQEQPQAESHHMAMESHTAEQTLAQVKDPVCGMSVGTDCEHSAMHQGRGYYFCSADCREAFEKEPKRYLKKEVTEKPAALEKVTDLVCGMEISAEGALKTEHEGGTHYFCSAHCKEAFEKEPKKFTEKEGR